MKFFRKKDAFFHQDQYILPLSIETGRKLLSDNGFQSAARNQNLNGNLPVMKTATCIRCKFFRMKDADQGLCRVDRSRGAEEIKVLTVHTCGKWEDCGQQYYIRLGWIRGQKKTREEDK